ncbi:MAG: hypothetical protein J6H31_12065 [Butyrivibrio sp.]|nr:hypothetical protein [Butyrivibrio sp.]
MRLSFSAGAIVGKKIYFSDGFLNALIEGDIRTGECVYIGKFPGEENSIRHLHRNAVLHDECIVFGPDKGKYIHIYDINSGEIRGIKIFRSSNSEFVFSNSFIDGDDLWIFPGNIEQPILKVNLVSGEEEKYDNLVTVIGDKRSRQSCAVLNAIKYEKRIYAPIFGTSSMVVFEMDTGKVSVKDLPIENMFFVFLINNKKWISTRDSIFEWDDKSNVCIKYTIEDSVVEPILFPGMQNKMLLISAIGGEVYELKTDTFILNPQLYFEKTTTYTIGLTYEGYLSTESGILITPPYGKKCVLYENGNFRELTLLMNKESWNQDMLISIKTGISEEILYEGTYIELNEFIKAI